MVLSNSPQAAVASSGVIVSRILFCRSSIFLTLKLAGLGMPSRPTRSPDHWAGNHEPPDGQSEHHPLERTFCGLS